MTYSAKLIADISKAPKTLGTSLGRWAVHLDFPVIRIALVTGATRQSVYNWFKGGEVFVAYRPIVSALIQVMQTSGNAEEVWIRSVKLFNLNEQ
jgi:hypothetical protein